MRGMMVSVMTTSGWHCPTMGNASRPSPASPTTLTSGWASMSERTPCRSMA